jgi:hypothetical protein
MRLSLGALPCGTSIFVASMALTVGQSLAQPYLPFYEAPGFNSETNVGYTAPSFRDTLPSGSSATGRLLNNAGTATWNAVEYLNQRRALRWSPLDGPVETLNQFASDFSNPIVYAINASGTVMGHDNSQFLHTHALHWDAGGTGFTQLGGGFNLAPVAAYDINDSGVSVGYGDKSSDAHPLHRGTRAMRWDAAGNATELGVTAATAGPEGTAFLEAVAINESNAAIGIGRVYSGVMHKGLRAVRWDAAGAATDLGHLGTDSTGSANVYGVAINAAGAAVGSAPKYDTQGNYDGRRGVRWNAGSTTAIELEVLGTDADGFTDSQALDINDAGVAAGFALKYNEQGLSEGRRAVLWNDEGQVTELGNLPGGYEGGEAYDVNEHGIAVGSAERPEGFNSTFVAVYWDAAGNAVDLNTLIAPRSDWLLTQALAISDTGWILGQGSHTYDPDGPGGQAGTSYSRVFMMQVPVAPVELAGDYNNDGQVDAADYVTWRDHLGANVTLPNDTTPGSVIDFDYQVWQASFGETIGDGSATNVPEPAALLLAPLAGLAIFAPRRKRD